MIELIPLVLGLVLAGLAAGLIGGLFGVGGGVVMVPALNALLAGLGFDLDVRMHVAVATSLATIIATSAASLRAHARSGAVDWDVLASWTPGVAIGAGLGAFLATQIDGRGLQFIFAGLALVVAATMAFVRPDWKLANDLPGGAARLALSGGIGVSSAMMGIGGGAIGVSLMTLCGRPIHQAVATASGFGAAIGIPGLIAYMIGGWNAPGLPPLSLGYANLVGVLVMGALTSLMAPLGARLAHRLDKVLLKRLFAGLLTLMALNMAREALLG